MQWFIRVLLLALAVLCCAGLHHDTNAESFSGRLSPGLARFKESMKQKMAALEELALSSAAHNQNTTTTRPPRTSTKKTSRSLNAAQVG